MKTLINAGCDVNLSDKDGWTPLSVAAFHGHTEVIKLLLASGADPSKEVEDGDTAYDKAVAWDHPECAALLKGPRLPARPRVVLHTCARRMTRRAHPAPPAYLLHSLFVVVTALCACCISLGRTMRRGHERYSELCGRQECARERASAAPAMSRC